MPLRPVPGMEHGSNPNFWAITQADGTKNLITPSHTMFGSRTGATFAPQHI